MPTSTYRTFNNVTDAFWEQVSIESSYYRDLVQNYGLGPLPLQERSNEVEDERQLKRVHRENTRQFFVSRSAPSFAAIETCNNTYYIRTYTWNHRIYVMYALNYTTMTAYVRKLQTSHMRTMLNKLLTELGFTVELVTRDNGHLLDIPNDAVHIDCLPVIDDNGEMDDSYLFSSARAIEKTGNRRSEQAEYAPTTDEPEGHYLPF